MDLPASEPAKKKLRWWKPEDGIVESASRLATILTFVFAIFVYTHTIYPVFTKENELLQARTEVKELREQGIRLTDDIKGKEDLLAAVKKEVAEQEAEKLRLQKEVTVTRGELEVVQSKAREYQLKATNATVEAVNAHIQRHMSSLVREGVDAEIGRRFSSSDKPFDIRTRTIAFADDGLKREKADSIEFKAYQVLKVFATDKLKEGEKDYKKIIEIMVFGQYDPQALRIINGQ